MHFARNLLLGALAYGATACASADLGPSTPNIPPLAFVRYINAIPDTLNTTVRWIDDVAFTPQTFVNVPFRGLGQGNFQGLRAGERRLRVFTYQQVTNNFPEAGNTVVLVDTTFNFQAGSYYTMIHAGYARAGFVPAQRLLIIEDAPAAEPAAGTLLRVYNAAYNLSWDMHVGGTAAVTADASVGAVYTPAQLGTLVASGAPGNVETVVLPYAARTTGNYAARLTDAGALTSLGVRVAPPTGLPETADFEAAGGANVTGSVLSAFVFNAKTAGSPNSTGTVNTRPSVLFTVDRSPARTIAP